MHRFCVADVVKEVEILVGGSTYDKLTGYAIDVLLKKQNKSHTQSHNQIIIPIPFDIISGTKLIFFELINIHEVRININFGTKCSGTSELIVSYYNYYNFTHHNKSLLKYYPNINCSSTIVSFINVFDQIQYKKESIEKNISFIQTTLDFDHVTSDIFFMFTDDETGEIINDIVFKECILSFEGYNKSVNSFILLKHKSKENNCDNGVYWLSLKGIQKDNQYDTYPNLSTIDDVKLSLNGVTNEFKKYSLLICAISRNFTTYLLQNGIYSSMCPLYRNKKYQY